MEYRFDPAPVGGGRSRAILLLAGAVIVVIAVVIGLRWEDAASPEPATIATSPPAVRSSATPPTVVAPSTTVPTAVRSGPPPTIRCHALAADRCAAIASAVLAAVAGPTLSPPTRVEIWASLLCGSTFDCPPARLEGRRPAGSAVVTTGTTALWVNVSEPAPGPGALEAWVIRSGPA